LSMITANAQLENSNWIFGNNVNLNFPNDTSIPNQIFDPNIDHQNYASASVSNESGELLFYVDSNTDKTLVIKNNEGDIMPNGVLSAIQVIDQNSVIVKKPGSCNIYYVFTFKNNNPNYGYNYTEVDMNLEGGLGNVTTNKELPLLTHDIGTNFPLNSIKSPKMTSYSTDEINHTWLVAEYSNFFYSYKIDSTGVTIIPEESANFLYKTIHDEGIMKVSPNGKKIATTNYSLATADPTTFEVHIYNFNYSNGVIAIDNSTNISNINSKYNGGLEFSPNSEQLYFTTSHIAQLWQSNTSKRPISNKKPKDRLYQYTIGKKASLPVLIAEQQASLHYKGLQRAINGKIYIAQNSSIGVINFPNNSGTFCNYTPIAIPFINPNNQFPQWVHKSGASIGDSWAIDFGIKSFKENQDIATDSEGNVYVLSSRLNAQSDYFTTIFGGEDHFEDGHLFVAKFNPCRELVAYKILAEGYVPNIGYSARPQDFEIKVYDDEVYIFTSKFTNVSTGVDKNFYRLNPTNLDVMFSHNLEGTYIPSNYTKNTLNNDIYIAKNANYLYNGSPITAGSLPTITRISSANGNIIMPSQFFPANVSFSKIISKGSAFFVLGNSTTSNVEFGTSGNSILLPNASRFILKLNYDNSDGSFTAEAVVAIDNDIINPVMDYNESSQTLYLTFIKHQQVPLEAVLTNIKAYDANLTLLPNQLSNLPISDIKSKGNYLLVSFFANAGHPTFLRKYNSNLSGFEWESNEIFTGLEQMSDTKIAVHNDDIFLTGEYGTANASTNTSLPSTGGSSGYNGNLFALRIKDNGATFAYREANLNNIQQTSLLQKEAISVNDQLENHTIFKIFPNPFNNTINITSNTLDAKNYNITISNLLGTQKINSNYNTLTQKSATINTTNLPKGVYAITISENSTIVYQGKVIK